MDSQRYMVKVDDIFRFEEREKVKIFKQGQEKYKGKKGAPARRERVLEALKKYKENQRKQHEAYIGDFRCTCRHDCGCWKREKRFEKWKRDKVVELANKVFAGELQGDSSNTYWYSAVDFVSPYHGSEKSPYFDMGGEGLGLIVVHREREYARSSGWAPSSAHTQYLVGRNEAGTYFSHPVPIHHETLKEALNWIWNGKAEQIIQRQGDIALIWGRGPKLPNNLPEGHTINEEKQHIEHESHAPLPLPGKGERVIVARRASDWVVDASRD